MNAEGKPAAPDLPGRKRLGFALAALAAFHLGMSAPALGWLVLLVPGLLWPLSLAPTWRRAFYPALGLGYLMYAPWLGFFYTIFGLAAALLWLVLAFWLAIHVVVVRAVGRRWGRAAALAALPVVWTGIEYFRSELYCLRFSWLTPGLALPAAEAGRLFHVAGVYGVGFLAAALGALAWTGRRGALTALGMAGAVASVALLFGTARPAEGVPLQVAGLQVEGVPEEQLPRLLERLRRERPDTALYILPEYALEGEPKEELLAWCRERACWLVVGGRRRLAGGGFHNTAFVVSPEGRVVFEQAKSVPIQFFDDGRPAAGQRLWDSPWGPLGILICYDLSYTRVTDRLVAAGARALLVPTLDEIGWGLAQHRLHGRVAPARAAEYGLPVVRVASSGISQIVAADGRITASAPFSEDVVAVAGETTLAGPGRRPADRWLAPPCAVATGLLLLALRVSQFRLARSPRARCSSPSSIP